MSPATPHQDPALDAPRASTRPGAASGSLASPTDDPWICCATFHLDRLIAEDGAEEGTP